MCVESLIHLMEKKLSIKCLESELIEFSFAHFVELVFCEFSASVFAHTLHHFIETLEVLGFQFKIRVEVSIETHDSFFALRFILITHVVSVHDCHVLDFLDQVARASFCLHYLLIIIS